jgi:hypothetical protein
MAGGGTPGPVALAVEGNRVLAVGSNGSASSIGGRWQPAGRTGLGVRDVAIAGPRAWAISEAGGLLGGQGGQWRVVGRRGQSVDRIARAIDALGGGALDASGKPAPAHGLRALSFRTASEGYAVGAGGAILRADAAGWHPDRSPVTSNLNDVAAGPGGVIAVGDNGVLLERNGNRWNPSQQAWELAAGGAITAAAALPDGTLLAAAGQRLLAKPRSDGGWTDAGIPPAGRSVTKLEGYRDPAGQLHALALVDAGPGAKQLLDGDASGWRPVNVDQDVSVSDFGMDQATGVAMVAGTRGSQSVSVPVDLTGQAASAPAGTSDGAQQEPTKAAPLDAPGLAPVVSATIGGTP